MGAVFASYSLIMLGLFCSVFLFYFLAASLKMFCLKQTPRPTILEVSNAVVMAVQAIVSVLVGSSIMTNTEFNMIEGSDLLTNDYIYALLGYVLFELWVIAYIHYQKHRQALRKSGWLAVAWHVLTWEPLPILQQVWFLTIVMPTIMWWREGRGDYIIGSFLVSELCIPFCSVCSILTALGYGTSHIYIISCMIALPMYLLCRVLLVPHLLYKFSEYAGIRFTHVVRVLPFQSLANCGVLFASHLHHMLHMLLNFKYAIMSTIAAPAKTPPVQPLTPKTKKADASVKRR